MDELTWFCVLHLWELWQKIERFRIEPYSNVTLYTNGATREKVAEDPRVEDRGREEVVLCFTADNNAPVQESDLKMTHELHQSGL